MEEKSHFVKISVTARAMDCCADTIRKRIITEKLRGKKEGGLWYLNREDHEHMLYGENELRQERSVDHNDAMEQLRSYKSGRKTRSN